MPFQSMGHIGIFNAKLGNTEGAFFVSWFPALNVGIFDVGTKSQVTSMNIVDFLVGKTLGPFGRIHGGGYYGNPGSVLMNKNGCMPGATVSLPCAPGQAVDHQNTGGMVGYEYGFSPVKDKAGHES